MHKRPISDLIDIPKHKWELRALEWEPEFRLLQNPGFVNQMY